MWPGYVSPLRGEGRITGFSELLAGLAIIAVEDLLLEGFPIPLHQVEVGPVGREEDQRDSGCLQILRHQPRAIAAGVAGTYVDLRRFRVPIFELAEQGDGGWGIHRRGVMDHRFARFHVERAANFQPPTPGSEANGVVLSALDPTVPRHGIALRMVRIEQAGKILFIAVFLALFVLPRKFLADSVIGLAENQHGSFVDKGQATQRGSDAPHAVAHPKLFRHVVHNILGVQIQRLAA